jgi:hypothetical protein
VAVAIDRAGDAVPRDHLVQKVEIARGILLVAEDRPDDQAGGVIDCPNQAQPGPPALEPVVAAAIELEEGAFGRQPRTAAAICRSTPPARARDAGLAEDRAEAFATDDDPFALGQKLPEVAVIDRTVRSPDGDDRGPDLGRRAARGGSTSVAMDEPARAGFGEGRPQPPDLALRETEECCPLGHRQGPGRHSGENPRALLFACIHRDRLHGWRLTNSLGSRD